MKIFPEPQVVFSTPHGSHLYGLSTPDSDLDSFIVYANRVGRTRARYAYQRMEGQNDDLLTDLSTFIQYASKGVPQYLEAMWSTQDTVDVLGRQLRFKFRPDQYATEDTYIRTARNFWEKGEDIQSLRDPESKWHTWSETKEAARAIKLKRHAYRLCLNLQDMREFGWFNPTMGLRQQRVLEHMLHADETIDKYLGVTHS